MNSSWNKNITDDDRFTSYSCNRKWDLTLILSTNVIIYRENCNYDSCEYSLIALQKAKAKLKWIKSQLLKAYINENWITFIIIKWELSGENSNPFSLNEIKSST